MEEREACLVLNKMLTNARARTNNKSHTGQGAGVAKAGAGQGGRNPGAAASKQAGQDGVD